MTLAAGARLGPYEVLGPIGAGGMGEVWRARDERRGGFDLDGDGYTDHEMVRESAAWDTLSSDVGDQWSAYLQDSWQVLPSLTLKPGVRLDRATSSTTAGQEVADLEVWQPRLGVAWDLLGTGRSVLRASWGRFMHTTTNNLPSFLNSRGLSTLKYVGSEYSWLEWSRPRRYEVGVWVEF